MSNISDFRYIYGTSDIDFGIIGVILFQMVPHSNHHNTTKWLPHHPKFYIYSMIHDIPQSNPHPKFYVIALPHK